MSECYKLRLQENVFGSKVSVGCKKEVFWLLKITDSMADRVRRRDKNKIRKIYIARTRQEEKAKVAVRKHIQNSNTFCSWTLN